MAAARTPLKAERSRSAASRCSPGRSAIFGNPSPSLVYDAHPRIQILIGQKRTTIMEMDGHRSRLADDGETNNSESCIRQIRVPLAHSNVLHRERDMSNDGADEATRATVIEEWDERTVCVSDYDVGPVAHAFTETDRQAAHRFPERRPSQIESETCNLAMP